jgi:hypothetical protein
MVPPILATRRNTTRSVCPLVMRPDNGKSKPFMNKTKKNNNNYENGYK